ncbi:MAG: hypothetical protein Q9222_001016 [Ikaeria aurantiellina]
MPTQAEAPQIQALQAQASRAIEEAKIYRDYGRVIIENQQGLHDAGVGLVEALNTTTGKEQKNAIKIWRDDIEFHRKVLKGNKDGLHEDYNQNISLSTHTPSSAYLLPGSSTTPTMPASQEFKIARQMINDDWDPHIKQQKRSLDAANKELKTLRETAPAEDGENIDLRTEGIIARIRAHLDAMNKYYHRKNEAIQKLHNSRI